MNTSHTPKIFLSHATEDKGRFVEGFATRLRQNGIDAWLDKWEMQPGDSIVDRIFEEGIKNASAIIVVLSPISITKPWVREELNAAFIDKIKGKCKLIPVVIEECEIPVALQSIYYQRIRDLSSYDTELRHIVNAILGVTDKPPLGELPAHARQPLVRALNLTQQDSLVLRMVGDNYIESEQTYVNYRTLVPVADALGITKEELVESAQVLDRRGYLILKGFDDSPAEMISISNYGFIQYWTLAIFKLHNTLFPEWRRRLQSELGTSRDFLATILY